VTLAAGTVLLLTGDSIAGRTGMSGVVFGATLLAAATALPEISTGLEAVRLGDHGLAIGDIFGGNAFLPVLFVEASLLSGQAVLPRARKADIYLTGLGALVTLVYTAGLLMRPRRRVLRLGVDSLLVVGIYVVGVAGLIAVGGG
jgi:cation:H+ antiporter